MSVLTKGSTQREEWPGVRNPIGKNYSAHSVEWHILLVGHVHLYFWRRDIECWKQNGECPGLPFSPNKGCSIWKKWSSPSSKAHTLAAFLCVLLGCSSEQMLARWFGSSKVLCSFGHQPVLLNLILDLSNFALIIIFQRNVNVNTSYLAKSKHFPLIWR